MIGDDGQIFHDLLEKQGTINGRVVHGADVGSQAVAFAMSSGLAKTSKDDKRIDDTHELLFLIPLATRYSKVNE
jgi:hypothetical protein